MSDPVSMSLDDYIKSQKKTGKMNFGRNRRGPKANNSSPRGGAAGPYRGGQNSFRGRKGRQANNNVQGRWNNRGGSNRRNRNRRQFAGANANQRFLGASGGQGQGQNLRINANKRSRNANRQQRRSRNSMNRVAQGASGLQGPSKQRYFNNSLAVVGAGAVRPKKNQARRLRLRKNLNNGAAAAVVNQRNVVVANKNTKRAFLKLAKKRVQRAKLLVSRKKSTAGAGKLKKIIAATSSGRLALVKNGFVTVKNTKAKRMERALVQMKIARAQQARNRISPQQNITLPGSSTGGKRSARARKSGSVRPSRALDWNTSIVRTMTNDLVDEMSSSQLNPDIQRKIAFIQSRSKGERVPVMPDFKAPVTTSRMKLSDRFRLLRDQ